MLPSTRARTAPRTPASFAHPERLRVACLKVSISAQEMGERGTVVFGQIEWGASE